MASELSKTEFMAWAVSSIDRKKTTPQQELTFDKWAEYSYITVLNEIARDHDFAVLYDEDTSITTEAGTFRYTLPARTCRIYRIVYEWDNSSYSITGISPLLFDRDFPFPESMGNARPGVFCRRDEKTINLAPPPDQAKTLRIYRSLWPTTDGSANMEYEHIDDIVHAGMVAELYHNLGLDTDAETWWKKYQQKIDKAVEKDSENPGENLVARGFMPLGGYGNNYFLSNYWANPFIKGNP
jgi:hypothetical protein